MGNNPKNALDAWKKRNAINATPQSGAMNGAGADAPASGASVRQPKTALEAWKERNQPAVSVPKVVAMPVADETVRVPAQEELVTETTQERLARLQHRRSELSAGLDLDGAAALQPEIDRLEKQVKMEGYAGKVYEDDFAGQFSASMAVGRLQQEEAKAWGDYAANPTQENRERARSMSAILKRVQTDNAKTLDEDATLPWLSQSLAGYLPQFWDQTKAQVGGAATGAALAAMTPWTAPFAGKAAKAGATAATGLQSYQVMRGRAFKELLDLGVDEETARKAANDEAVISSMIEMAETGIDLFAGLGSLIKGGGEVATEAAKPAAKKLLSPLGKYGLNVGTEWLEEGSQQAVSIADRANAVAGETGKIGLVRRTGNVLLDAALGRDKDAAREIVAAGGEGAKIAAMMGLPGMVGNATMSTIATENPQVIRGHETQNAAHKTDGVSVDKKTRETMEKLGLRSPTERAETRLQAEAENEVKGLEAFGTTDPERQKQFIRARQIAERFGCELQVETLAIGMEGKYENGVITLDPTVDKPVMRVLIHELTHRMESSGLYGDFSKMVMRTMSGEMDVEAVKRGLITDYREGGIELTDDGANRELVAKFAESRLFQDEASIQRLLREDRTIFEKIYDWIRDTITMVKGTEEERFLVGAQRLYEKALRTSEPKTGMSEGQNLIARTRFMSWAEQINGALYAGKNIRRNDTLIAGYPVDTVAENKISNKPLAIPQSILTKASDGRDISHSIKRGKLAKLDEGIKNAPITIINPDRNAVVYVTNIKQGGLPIVVAFDLDTNFDGDDVHKATSIHLQVDTQSMLEALPESATVYIQKNELDPVGATNNLRGLAAKIEFIDGTISERTSPVKYDIPNLGQTSSAEKETDTVDTENPSPEANRSTASLSISSIRKNAGGVNKENSATYPERYNSVADVQEGDYRPLPTAEEIENGGQHSYGRSFEELAATTRREAEPGMEKWKRDAAKEVRAPLDELMQLYENAAGFTSEEDSWSGSPDEERMREVEALISAGSTTERKGLRENLGESWSYFKRKMVDAGDSVSQFAKAVKDDHLYPFYNMARSSASAGVNMITGEQTDMMGRRVGDSLNSILDPVRKKGKEYYNQFQMYMFDLHNIDRMSIGEKATVDRIEAEQALAEFDRKYPGVAQLTEDRLRRNAENRLDMEGSALARERLKLLRKVNRADRMGNKPVFDWDITAQKSKARAEQLLREHPEFAEYQEKIRKYIRNLMQYRVDSGLITAEDAAFLEHYYPNYVPTYRRTVKGAMARDRKSLHVGKTVGRAEGGTEELQPLHEALGKQTMQVVREGSKNRFGARLLTDYLNDPKNEKAGKYIIGAQEYEAEFGLDSIDQAETEWKKDNTFTVYENGKLFEIQMDPSMFDAVKALYPDALENNVVVKAIRAGNNLFKALVTGYNPTFTVRNTVRDLQTAGLHSWNAAAFAQNYPLALREIATNGSYWKRYQALGGSFSSVFDYQTGTVKEPKGKLGKLAAKVEALNMAMEQAPRLAEFMSVVKAGDGSMENLMDAIHAAADVTVNFGRAGTLGKVLNANFVPFLNPGIQGFDKLVRRVVQNKGTKEWAKLAVRAAVLGVAPSLLNALLYDDDEDWEDLKDSDKDTNYMFKIGDGLWLKIPKGRELSILGMTADRITDMVDGEKVDWSDFIATVGNQVAPANPLEQNIAKAWIDTDLFDASSPGRTWYGGDIESQRLRNYAPGERYDSSVDIFSKWLGKQLNLSPKKINYLLDQYSGVLGDFALPLLTPQAERDPFTKAFTVDSVSSNRISNEFYDMSEELMYTKNSGNATAKVTDRFWAKQEEACSELYADIRAIEEDPDLSDKKKKQQVRETRAVLNGIQKNALAVLPTYRNAVKKCLTGSSDEAIDRAYREANRECFGAEYAIKTYNKDVYAKATEAKESGISFNTYYEYYFAKKGLKKKAEVMAVIKKLDIPWEQKDALYLLEGYSEKTIDETPWYMERWRLPAP